MLRQRLLHRLSLIQVNRRFPRERSDGGREEEGADVSEKIYVV